MYRHILSESHVRTEFFAVSELCYFDYKDNYYMKIPEQSHLNAIDIRTGELFYFHPPVKVNVIKNILIEVRS